MGVTSRILASNDRERTRNLLLEVAEILAPTARQ